MRGLENLLTLSWYLKGVSFFSGRYKKRGGALRDDTKNCCVAD